MAASSSLSPDFSGERAKRFATGAKSGEFYVKNEYRSKGIGKALLEELIRQLRSQPGLEQIALGVSIGNTSAKRLYESLGFEVYGRETNAVKIGGAYMHEELMVLYFSR